MVYVNYTKTEYFEGNKPRHRYGIIIQDDTKRDISIICRYYDEGKRDAEINKDTIIDVLAGEEYPFFRQAEKDKFFYFNDNKIVI